MISKIENIPNASVLIDSMRSIGYDFESALSDIIDNSISALATQINILFPVDKQSAAYIVICDNGNGMNRRDLIEAMRFGSVKCEKRTNDDLGRFGLGLKTASISQCKRFTIVSKKDGMINAFSWDLDIIENSPAWEMLEISIDSINSIPGIENCMLLDTFTVVFWEKLDRLEKDVHSYKTAQDVFFENISSAEKHISLVFHRFLTSGLSIHLNGSKIEPIDPFLYRHPKTLLKPQQIINVKTSNGNDEKY